MELSKEVLEVFKNSAKKLRRKNLKIETKLEVLREANTILIKGNLLVGIYEEHISELVYDIDHSGYELLNKVNRNRFICEVDIYIDLFRLILREKIRENTI